MGRLTLIAMANPNLAAAAIAQRLQQSATSSFFGGGWDQFLGYGILNAFQAVSGTLRPGGALNAPAEDVLRGTSASTSTFRAAAEAAVHDPFTVPGTAFKVELAKRTLVRALQTATGVTS